MRDVQHRGRNDKSFYTHKAILTKFEFALRPNQLKNLMISFRLLAVASLLFLPSSLWAQNETRVHVSNDDPRWGEKITVTYNPASGSIWANPDNHDTLYCASNVRGVHPEHAIIKVMQRLNDTTYGTVLAIPDSTYSIRMEICIPTDRAPNGITVFTCRTRDGRPTPGGILGETTNFDSTLKADLALYPKDYTAYVESYDNAQDLARAGQITITDSARKATLIWSTDQLLEHPDSTASWHLGLASLYLRRSRDSLATISIANAARCTRFDPIYNDVDFWNHFFLAAKMSKDGGLEWPVIHGRMLAALIERFPHTTMAGIWIQLEAFDTVISATVFRHVASMWRSSHDVDVLLAIARCYGFERGPAYDPKIALEWYDRAEESSRTRSGFFSGDNIWSSMGRLSSVLAGKAELLAKLGRTEEAIALARKGLTQTRQQYEKQELDAVIAKVYLDAGRLEDAKHQYGIALAANMLKPIAGLDLLYQRCKRGDETQAEFAKWLVAAYGHEVELPAIPDFRFTTLDGIRGTLSRLRGKVVVIDCWFTTCGGCVIEKSSLNKLVDSYVGDTNVVFLSIALDDATTLKRYLEHTPSKFKVIPDGQELCNKLGVTDFPTHIIIGRDGKTYGFQMGGSKDGGDLIRPKIDEALGKM